MSEKKREREMSNEFDSQMRGKSVFTFSSVKSKCHSANFWVQRQQTVCFWYFVSILYIHLYASVSEKDILHLLLADTCYFLITS